MANNSSLSKRAALRQQQELEERAKRNKRIAGFGIGTLAVIAVVVIAIVVFQALSGGRPVAAEQYNPPGATANYGIIVGDAPKDDIPHLVVWQDYQCPACASYDASYGPIIDELRAEGSITVEYRTAHFLDESLRNQASKEAAYAAAAAAEVGYFDAFRKVVFENQPTEGVGYTKAQLREEFPAKAGITGDNLTRFQELYDTTPFKDFVASANAKFKEQATGTPTYLVAGQALEFVKDQQLVIQQSKSSLKAAIDEAWNAGGKNNAF